MVIFVLSDGGSWGGISNWPLNHLQTCNPIRTPARQKHLGSSAGAKVLTQRGTGETALPHAALPWIHFLHNTWTASDDIRVDNFVEGKLDVMQCNTMQALTGLRTYR